MLELIPIFQGTPDYGKVNGFQKYQIILQHSEEDCGAACLAAIAKYYRKNLTINRLREAVGTAQQGTTLLGLKQGAETIGFNARSVRASPEILDKLDSAPLPAIIHWQGYHWVVLYGRRGKKYVIADPAIGIRYLSKKELAEGWQDWVCLLLEPNPTAFFAQSEEPGKGLGEWLRQIWNYRQILSLVLLLNLVLGFLSLAAPFLISILTDDVLVRGDTQLLANMAIAVIVLNLFSGCLELVQSNAIAHFAQRLELSLIMEFGRKILRLPLNYYESRRSGEVVSRLTDIEEINQLVSESIVSLPSQFFIAIVSLGLMLFYNPSLAATASIIGGIMTLSTILFQPILQQKNRNLLALESETQGVLVETFKGSLTLKTTSSEPQFWEELQGRFGRLANLSYSTTQIGIFNETFSEVVSSIGAIAIIWFGSNSVIAGELSIGQLLAFIALNQNVSNFINTLVGLMDELTRVQTATKRISEVIEATPETKGDEGKALRGNC